MTWRDTAKGIIAKLTADLPKDSPFRDRVKLLRDNYPFARRSGFAYRVWCEEQRKYLVQFLPPKGSKRYPRLPLEIAIDDAMNREGAAT